MMSDDKCSVIVCNTGVKTFSQMSWWFWSSPSAILIEALTEQEDAGCSTLQVGHS